MKKSIQELESERIKWSIKTFTDANEISSLEKLIDEIEEVKFALSSNAPIEDIVEEYADCLMCLFDSAGRIAISPDDIFSAFEKKLAKNKARVWKKNDNNTYSHIKK